LKVKITPDEFGAIFGNIKPIAMLHTNLLKQLESMPAKYEPLSLFHPSMMIKTQMRLSLLLLPGSS